MYVHKTTMLTQTSVHCLLPTYIVPLLLLLLLLLRLVCKLSVPIWMNVVEKCRLDMWSIVLMNWRIWPLANVLNFGLVPIQLQVLVNQILAFFWCIYISTRIE
jgi:Mpv17 / PMP22 family